MSPILPSQKDFPDLICLFSLVHSLTCICVHIYVDIFGESCCACERRSRDSSKASSFSGLSSAHFETGSFIGLEPTDSVRLAGQ